MIVKASVIIPSYNARERLYLNLTALNSQSYNEHDVEVIVVDNGSTDNTLEMLKAFQLKYPMKIVRIEENRGIAQARNKGILEAEGDLLIFHDSDMIASKDFIRLHLDMHKEPGIVACGLFWRRIFTFYYKRFTGDQVANFGRVTKSHGIYKEFRYEDAYPLISENQVKYMDLFPYSFDLDFGFINDLKEIIRQYGRNLDGYYLPWRFCITNNMSVERERVTQVGMFDANIVKYGYEDYDLGVRLYKSGCRFVMADHIVSLHQEHPANYNSDDLFVNINYMCSKYNNIYFIDVPLVCLSDNLRIDKTRLNGIARDLNEILMLGEYNDLLQLFLDVLQLIRKRTFAPLEENSTVMMPKIFNKIDYYVKKTNELRKKKDVSHFIQQLASMLKQALNIEFERLLKASP